MQEADSILAGADTEEVAFLVVGDPFGCETQASLKSKFFAPHECENICGQNLRGPNLFRATTHTDIQLRAKAAGIHVNTVPNASILNAVGACGLQLYRYGEVWVAFSFSLAHSPIPVNLRVLIGN